MAGFWAVHPFFGGTQHFWGECITFLAMCIIFEGVHHFGESSVGSVSVPCLGSQPFPPHSGPGDLQGLRHAKKPSGIGQAGAGSPVGAPVSPREPGEPHRPIPTPHAVAESLLQVRSFLTWHRQELPGAVSHPPPRFLGQPYLDAQFPFGLNAEKELSSYRLVWIWARYLKIHGWERKGEV